jgi:hypothetical protein
MSDGRKLFDWKSPMRFRPILLVSVFFISGCQTYYYKFTDNQSQKVFYKALSSPPNELPASIALADPNTGAVTVTTAYTATPISAEEYDANRPKYVH